MTLERLKYIDITRAIAMFLIVLGHTLVHSEHCSIIYKFIYSFHVILFFIISGFTFSAKKKFLEFLKGKFLRIMVPYFVWAFLFLIPYALFSSGVSEDLDRQSSLDLLSQIKTIFYGDFYNLMQNRPLWFLPALFTTEVIYYFIIKFSEKFPKSEIPLFITMILVSFVADRFLHLTLPWGLNQAVIIGWFLYLGYLIKKYNILEKILPQKHILVPVFLVIGFLAFYFNDTIDCMTNSYRIFPLTILSSLSFSFVVIIISHLIKENRLLEYIGKNTMGILIFHRIIILLFQTKLGVITSILNNSNVLSEFVLALIVTTIAVLLSLVANYVVKKVFPILVGENGVIGDWVRKVFK